jgi:hypothetical protein
LLYKNLYTFTHNHFNHEVHMRANAVILLVIGLLFLVGTVAAYIPDSATIGSDKIWIIANGVDQSIITVEVKNSTFGPVENAKVDFSINNTLGTISSFGSFTGTSGRASTTFNSMTTSGATLITAIITYSEPGGSYSNTFQLTQNIDHDVPVIPPSFDHPNEGTVGTVVPFNITFTDRWGNPIDDRKPGDVHTVQLTVYGPDPNDCVFVGNGQGISKNLNSDGTLSVLIKLTSKPGLNNIIVSPLWSTSSIGRTIDAVANAAPASMTVVIDPPGTPPSLPADGIKTFTIRYTLIDQYGNPSGQQNVSFNNGIAEQTSNSDGEVWINFGPKPIGDYSITATVTNNPSISMTNPVRFYNQLADNFDLRANPKILASYDANQNARAYITAKVIDGNGFPVKNQAVSFVIKAGSISPAGYCPVCNVTALPYLVSPTTVTTDVNGNAVVALVPGAFIKDKTSKNYTAAATGSCVVSATWNSVTKDTEPILWKNYPYLTVTTNVTPLIVNVSDTVDVRILLNGDGFGYSKKPIDVGLVIDRSGSMANTLGSNSKIRLAKNSAESFVNQMDNTTDRLAVVSYAGITTGTETKINAPITSDFTNVNNGIENLNANGATETRVALKTTIDLLNASPNPNPKAIQALILLTDGDYNWQGNPLGRGTGWPADNPDYTFSGNTLEDQDYLYYTGLGGTLTPYDSTTCSVYSNTNCDQYSNTNCDQRSSTVCDTCASGYSKGTGSNANKCCRSGTCYTPAQGHCSIAHCDQWHCNQWHCVAYVQNYKCLDGETTNQNMTNYAISKNVRIYTIGFANGLSSQAVKDMNTLAVGTGGFYRNASTGTDLTSVYNEIAGDLKSEAAVNTSMTLDFGVQTITVNDFLQNGEDVFSYVNDSSTSLSTPGSTWINKYNKTTTNYPTYPFTIDDTSNWTNNKALTFNVGTIKLNETWETNFRLKVLREGNIQIFGPTSVINFTDSMGITNSLTLPNTSISARQVATNKTEKTIKLTNLAPTGSVSNSIPMGWTTKYDGNSTVTERVYYSYNNGPWYLFNLQTGILNGTSSQTATLDVSSFPSGNYYIRVVATSTSNDAAMVYTTYGPIPIVGKSIFIRLE